MRAFCVVFLLLVLIVPVFAQEQEAGQYERKSVSYINALWLLDPTARALSGDQVSYVLEKVKQGVSMSRFDYNPLPESLLKNFVDRANQSKKLTIDQIANLMDETLVPKIVKILDAEKELRAASLQTEQQKNSFISDKAKDLDVTGEQMQKIMNSAYLYLPVISGVVLVRSGPDSAVAWKATANMGILWYSLKTDGPKPSVTLKVKSMTLVFGLARVKRATAISDGNYVIDGQVVPAREYAFRSMVRSGVKNLVVATQRIKDFQLSGQVLESGFSSVGFDLGTKEGLFTDDKYLIMEQVEVEGGEIEEEKIGWVLVSKVADTSDRPYKSTGILVSGSPSSGNILREYPRLPIDLAFGYRSFPLSGAVSGDDKISGGQGGEIIALYNIGRLMGLNQLFLGFAAGAGGGSITGQEPMPSAVCNTLEGVLQKKFYLRRCALVPEIRFGAQGVTVTSDDSSGTNAALGLAAGGKLEFALAPSLNIGGGASFHLHGESNDWVKDGITGTGDPIDHSGLAIRAYLNWSPPQLPFDPWEMLRGLSGI